MTTISLTVNGRKVERTIEARTTLGDFLREDLDLTAAHLACEHGVCGACTVLLDNQPVRSCITLSASASGHTVHTLEGFQDDPLMALLRECFSKAHALQCGYCTPGMLITARDMILRGVCTSDVQIRRELSGNLCRCTGYQGIVEAIKLAHEQWQASQPASSNRAEPDFSV